jgi:hypothetical protein
MVTGSSFSILSPVPAYAAGLEEIQILVNLIRCWVACSPHAGTGSPLSASGVIRPRTPFLASMQCFADRFALRQPLHFSVDASIGSEASRRTGTLRTRTLDTLQKCTGLRAAVGRFDAGEENIEPLCHGGVRQDRVPQDDARKTSLHRHLHHRHHLAGICADH